jgi:thiol:disulfide interchange protein DsbC
VTPEKRDCENPIREQMALGQRLGLRGTPYTITDTGQSVSGYRPAPELFESLEEEKARLLARQSQ